MNKDKQQRMKGGTQNIVGAGMKKIGVEARDSKGRQCWLSFLAESEETARQIVQQKGLTLQRLYPLPQPPLVHPHRSQSMHMNIRHARKRLEFVIASHMPTSDLLHGLSGVAVLLVPPLIVSLGLSNELLRAVIGGGGGLWWFLYAFRLRWVDVRLKTLQRCLDTLRREKIIMTNDVLMTQRTYWGVGTTAHYAIADITNIRHISDPSGRQDRLMCDYRSHAITLCHDMDSEIGRVLTQALTETFHFSCQSVERIIFGDPARIPVSPVATLHNPDVSTLTIPFIRLAHIAIDSHTYDFHLVERFLTYALHSMGAEMMKKRVMISVYGTLQELHPNIRNTLTNVCRSVSEYSGEA